MLSRRRKMANGFDVAVIGGGIVGVACAYTLARDGLSVLVADAGSTCGRATDAALGHVAVVGGGPDDPLFVLARHGRRKWAGIGPELSSESGVRGCGTVWVANDATEMCALAARATMYAETGVGAIMLDEVQLARQEPALRMGCLGGMFVPGDHVVVPAAAAKWFLARARTLGVTVRQECRAQPVTRERGGLRLTLDKRGGASTVVSVGAVVNAAGAGAGMVTPGAPVVARRAHLVMTSGFEGRCRGAIVEPRAMASNAARVGTEDLLSITLAVQSRGSRELVLGGAWESVDSTGIDSTHVARAVVRHAARYLPELTEAHIGRIWSGDWSVTPDGLPLIGQWDDSPGVWLAAGHDRIGVATALATAQLVADGIAVRRPAIDPAPYAPTRPFSHLPSASASPRRASWLRASLGLG
jgi:D-hydroxyproline dehydrogenase subunit beta